MSFKRMFLIAFLALAMVLVAMLLLQQQGLGGKYGRSTSDREVRWTGTWDVPDIDTCTDSEVAYGRVLVTNTSHFYGPNGSISTTANGMDCQSCHQVAGTDFLGNNYSAVASMYPQVRARTGKTETIEYRISDCFQRSLNATPPAVESREMKALVAYMKWLGNAVPKGSIPKGAGIIEISYMTKPADPGRGKKVYRRYCSACHGEQGQGIPQLVSDAPQQKLQSVYLYPPLWGPHSYTKGAGMYRISRLAGFIKTNMPNGVTFEDPALTDEQAWDVAAFINSQPRPDFDVRNDWPDISKKPIDYPFGPYADSFPESQHKFGPYGPIASFYRSNR